jgi:hypothetical protein
MNSLRALGITVSLVVGLVAATGCSKKSSPTGQAAGSAAPASGSGTAGSSAAGSAAAAAPVAAGCTPESKPQAFKGSCNHGKTTCQEFTGSGFKPDGSGYGAKEGCDAAKATYSATERCPTAGMVGGCLANCGASSEMVTYHYVDDPQDKKACLYTEGGRASGTWLTP